MTDHTGLKPFWGLRFKDGSVPDGQYARGWTLEEAKAHALERWGEKADLETLQEWDGVL